MKTATPLLIVTCLTPLLFSACSTGSGYSDSQGYNSGPSGAANPYGVPRAGGEVGSYPQAPTSAENAPYQTLPAIVQAAPPASAPSASAPSARLPP